ncbi:MAG: SCP2 sterol-binding domain-containing protein [Candidatus Thermoplasmatota archaeon]|jgi:putative sterol carrier protein|nr:SCP2 sterol-binding domain-containing protein [Candidatus Thermoplasmatota archaeon]
MITKFSDGWFKDFCRRINEDQSYGRNGKGWYWNITFSVVGDRDSQSIKAGVSKIVKMKLKDGKCEGIEIMKEERVSPDEYLIRGSASVWEKIMEGKTSLINSMLKGDLKVTGDVKRLTAYIMAANDLARIASGVT